MVMAGPMLEVVEEAIGCVVFDQRILSDEQLMNVSGRLP